MKRATSLVALACLVASVSGAALFVWHERSVGKNTKPAQAGQVVVVIESQDAYNEANGTVSLGTGVIGTLGLIGGSCVGFVDQEARTSIQGQVIVWPPGTTVSGSGKGLRITSEGKTVRLGDQISAGGDLRRTFPELDDIVPARCRNLPRVPVGLNS